MTASNFWLMMALRCGDFFAIFSRSVSMARPACRPSIGPGGIRAQRAVIIRASSRFEVPSASSDRTRRSSDTDGSPDSIFATRDWLDSIVFASAVWLIPLAVRRARRPSASFRRNPVGLQ